MSLSDIGNKAQGQLWKAADWNELVTFVQDLDARVFGADGLAGQVASIAATQEDVRDRVATLGTRMDVLFEQISRVTLETARSRFALGEMAEVTARLTDLDGRPLSGAGANGFTIDFVSTRGYLRPARGFTATTGTDGRSISVRVNSDGIARVRLQPAHAASLSEDAENEASQALGTVLPGSNRPIHEAFLRAETPNQARLEGAFEAITAEYEAPQGALFRAYADAYYLDRLARPGSMIFPRPPIVAQPTIPWRRERATVLAFVKNDDDPVSPDAGRAVSSITVTFVDWLRHWIVNEYLVGFQEAVPRVREQLAAAIRDDRDETSSQFNRRLREVVREDSVLGRQRDFLAADLALETLPVQGTPTFVGDLRDSLRDAVSIQRALDNVQFATASGEREEVAFNVFARTGERTTRDSTGLTGKLDGIDERFTGVVAQLREEVEEQQRTTTRLNERLGGLAQSFDTLGGDRLRRLEEEFAEAIRTREKQEVELRNLGRNLEFVRGRLNLNIERPDGPGGGAGGGVIGRPIRGGG